MARSLPGQIRWSWPIPRKLHLRYDECETWTRTQQTKLTTLLDKLLKLEPGGAAKLGQQFHQQGHRHLKGLTVGCRRNAGASGIHDVREDKHHPDLYQDQFLLATPPMRHAQILFEHTKSHFNGTITNDKFCMSRTGKLEFSWWRLPRSARISATKKEYPTETTEMQRCSQEGTGEKTEILHPASHHFNDRCRHAMGSRLSSSDPMECDFFAGDSPSSSSPGEQP